MRALIVTLSALGMMLGASAAKADGRVALVVGNGAYKNLPRLSNAPASGKAMAKLLRSAGFEVIEGIDLSRNDMTRRLLEFGDRARGADIAVFYFAGQGVDVGGSEFLLPIDANVKSRMDVTLGNAVNADVAIDQTLSEAKVKLVFLDASRNDPFAATDKKAPASVSVKSDPAEMKSPDNSLIVFATGPGQAAPDGPQGSIRPLTRALIANIAAPGVEIEDAMTKVRAQVAEDTKGQQMSWAHSNNLAGGVYLSPASAPAASK